MEHLLTMTEGKILLMAIFPSFSISASIPALLDGLWKGRNMKEVDLQRSLGDAIYFQHLSIGPEYYFWVGYELGLRNYHGEKFGTESDDPNMDEEKHNRFMVGDDLESLGYRAGFAGLTVQDALAAGKKGVYRAGLNGNFHKSEPEWNVRDLEKMAVIYQGGGKWTLPKEAKIHRTHEIETFYRVQNGKDWVLRLADGSEWIVWSEDIAGIDGPPWVNE